MKSTFSWPARVSGDGAHPVVEFGAGQAGRQARLVDHAEFGNVLEGLLQTIGQPFREVVAHDEDEGRGAGRGGGSGSGGIGGRCRGRCRGLVARRAQRLGRPDGARRRRALALRDGDDPGALVARGEEMRIAVVDVGGTGREPGGAHAGRAQAIASARHAHSPPALRSGHGHAAPSVQDRVSLAPVGISGDKGRASESAKALMSRPKKSAGDRSSVPRSQPPRRSLCSRAAVGKPSAGMPARGLEALQGLPRPRRRACRPTVPV
jgi:hypothetical protein